MLHSGGHRAGHGLWKGEAVRPRGEVGWLAIGCAMLVLAGCGPDATGPDDPVVTSVVITPAVLELVEDGEAGQLNATVQTDQGTAGSPSVEWMSSDPSVAQPAGSGATASVIPVKPGTATITATAGGVSGSAVVSVRHGPRQLVVSLVGEGAVTADPDSLSCGGGTCVGRFAFGTTVTLSALPGSGYRVESWDGACQGTDAVCIVVMDTAQMVSLTFEPRVQENGYTKEINELVPDTLLGTLQDMGMPLHPGGSPPTVVGTYLMSPALLKASNVPGDPASGQFWDYYLRLTDQDDERLTVRVQNAQENGGQSVVGEGVGSLIAGSDSAFTVFSRITSVDETGDTAVTLQVYSATLTQGGLHDLHLALFMLDNRGNTQFIPNGTGRLAYDGDGFSPATRRFPELAGVAHPVGPSVASERGNPRHEDRAMSSLVRRR